MDLSTPGDIRHYSTEEPTALPDAVHATLELTFVTEGAATYQIGDRTRQLSCGSTMWVFPNRHHTLLTASPNFKTWVVTFPPELVARVQASFSPEGLAESAAIGTVFRKLGTAAAERLATLFSDLFLPNTNKTERVTPNPAALSYLLVSAWAEQSYANNDTNTSADLHPAVEKAAQLLRTEGGNVSLEELAKVCGASSAWLSRLFRQQMGVSLVDYRNQHRIERFFELYRSGHRLNITQAALEAGFGSYAQFHRVFRKRVGYGPAELRRKLSSAR